MIEYILCTCICRNYSFLIPRLYSQLQALALLNREYAHIDDITAFSLLSSLFRFIHRVFAIFIAPTVISRATRKLSHVSCTSNDVEI